VDGNKLEEIVKAQCAEQSGDFGATILAFRKAHKFFATDLAPILNVTVVTLSNWENGRSRPHPFSIKSILAILEDIETGRIKVPDRKSTLRGLRQPLQD
jgi:DNA-binding transcriptional regulator YiaG